MYNVCKYYNSYRVQTPLVVGVCKSGANAALQSGSQTIYCSVIMQAYP